MTAETSNARGEWVLVPRVPTDDMIAAAMKARDDRIQQRAKASGALVIGGASAAFTFHDTYRAMLATAPPPAAARGDVRGLVAKWRAAADAAYVAYIRKMDTDECRGWEAKVRAGTFARANLDAFTAAAELLGRHRALHAFASQLEAALAAEGVQAGEVEQRARELLAQHEQQDKTGGAPVVRRDDALRAIASALSQQPEARGGVDVEAIRRACQSGKRFWQAGPGYYEEIESLLPALTGERNG